MPSFIAAAEATRIAGLAADYFSITPAQLLSRSRISEFSEARWACWLYFQGQGFDCAEIGAAFGRDCDTVRHGLAKASKRPDLITAAAALENGSLGPEGPWLLRRYGPAIARPVLAYLTLLTEGYAPPGPALAGLRLIARNGRLQHDVLCVLLAHNRGHHFWRIAIHAKQLGLPVDNLSTGLSTGSA